MKYSLSIVLLILMMSNLNSMNLDPKRVHLVDYNVTTNTYFFRGNQPDMNGSFPMQEMYSLFTEELSTKGLGTPQEEFYLIDISLEDIVDGIIMDGYNEEKSFWQNPSSVSLGQFINWPIGMSGILPADKFAFSSYLSLKMAGEMVKLDNLLPKIEQIRGYLNQQYIQDKAVFIYIHCDEGCDRTGEIVGAYRLKYTDYSFQEIVDMNTQECGRVENFFSINGLEWFCIYYLHSIQQTFSQCQSVTY